MIRDDEVQYLVILPSKYCSNIKIINLPIFFWKFEMLYVWLPSGVRNNRQDTGEHWKSENWTGTKYMSFFQAQLQFARSVQVQLRTEISLIISVRPTHPGKYIWSTSRPPWRLKFGIEALFNQTKLTSQLASHQLVS